MEALWPEIGLKKTLAELRRLGKADRMTDGGGTLVGGGSSSLPFIAVDSALSAASRVPVLGLAGLGDIIFCTDRLTGGIIPSIPVVIKILSN